MPLWAAAFGIIMLSVQSIPPSEASANRSDGLSICAWTMSPDQAIATTVSPFLRSSV